MPMPRDLVPELNQSPPLYLEDPEIPSLRTLCDKNHMLQLLSKQFRGLKTLEIIPLAHVASMRATLLYRISTEDNKMIEWIAKTNMSKAPERVYANYWALWHASKESLSIPKPAGFMLNPSATFQDKVSGTRLGALVDSPHFSAWITLLAEMIAKFHQLNIPIRGTRDLAQEERNFHRWKDLLIQIRPDLKARLQTLGDKILEGFSRTFAISCPIHADFHHTNVLAEEKKITLIDMDEVAYGDPCVDVGRLLSSLRLPSLRVFGSFDGLKIQREKFLETYIQQRPEDRKKIHLFETAALFTSAASTFRLKRKDWSREVDLFIDEAERTLKEAKISGCTTSLPCKPSYPEWAKKEEYVRALLSPHIFQASGAEISSCNLVKEEKRRNYQILHYLLKLSEKEDSLSVELFIHSEKTESFLITQIASMNAQLEKENAGIRLQEPLAYLPELRAAVFYSIGGRSLKKEIARCNPEEMGQKLAESMRLIETAGGPFYFNQLSMKEISVRKGILYLHFTAPRTKKAGPFNMENFARQIRLYGKKYSSFEKAQQFLESFKKNYQQS